MNIAIVKTDGSNEVIKCSKITCHISVTKDSIQIDLNLETNIYNANIVISDDTLNFIDNQTSQRFTKFPIIIENVTYMTNKPGSYKNTGYHISNSPGSSKAIVNVALAGTNPAVSVLIDKIMSEFVYIELLNGPSMVFPNFILRNTFQNKYWPVDVGNPFKKLTKDEICDKSENLKIASRGCGMLVNSGEDIHALGYILAVNIFISMTGYVILKYTNFFKLK